MCWTAADREAGQMKDKAVEKAGTASPGLKAEPVPSAAAPEAPAPERKKELADAF